MNDMLTIMAIFICVISFVILLDIVAWIEAKADLAKESARKLKIENDTNERTLAPAQTSANAKAEG